MQGLDRAFLGLENQYLVKLPNMLFLLTIMGCRTSRVPLAYIIPCINSLRYI